MKLPRSGSRVLFVVILMAMSIGLTGCNAQQILQLVGRVLSGIGGAMNGNMGNMGLGTTGLNTGLGNTGIVNPGVVNPGVVNTVPVTNQTGNVQVLPTNTW